MCGLYELVVLCQVTEPRRLQRPANPVLWLAEFVNQAWDRLPQNFTLSDKCPVFEATVTVVFRTYSQAHPVTNTKNKLKM